MCLASHLHKTSASSACSREFIWRAAAANLRGRCIYALHCYIAFSHSVADVLSFAVSSKISTWTRMLDTSVLRVKHIRQHVLSVLPACRALFELTYSKSNLRLLLACFYTLQPELHLLAVSCPNLGFVRCYVGITGPAEDERKVYVSPATLLVLPPTLIPHWLHQIRVHMKPNTLRVAVLAGDRGPADEDSSGVILDQTSWKWTKSTVVLVNQFHG